MDINALRQLSVATLVAVAWKIAGALALWIVGRLLIKFGIRLLSQALARQKFDATLTRYMETGLGILLNIAAALGNSFGYLIGRMTGPRIFTREDSLMFNKKNVYRAQAFYARHGRKAIILAQFMPIIRTFSPVVAGVGQMPYRQFALISVIGTILWVWSMLFTGHFLGTYIPGIDKHIEILVLTVIFVSILPAIISWWREKRKTAAAAAN